MNNESAENQIMDCLLAYTRGIDRLDSESIVSAFHPGATLEGYRNVPTTIEDFSSSVIKSLREKYSATQHRLSNTKINFYGEKATVETYVLAFHVMDGDSGTPDELVTFNGRYIDKFENRDGNWRITERLLRSDWSKIEIIDRKMPNSFITGDRNRNDVSYN